MFTNRNALELDIAVELVAGSTFPLVEADEDVELEDYNPFQNRNLSHPTT